MKLKAEAIGFEKPITVKPSVKNYQRANKMLIQILQMQALATKADALKPSDTNYAQILIEVLNTEDKFMDDGLKFLKDTLKLTAKQMSTVEDKLTNANDLADYVSYVIQRIKGSSDAQIEADNKRALQERKTQDPKE